jgi:hypothetical protein
MYKYPSSPLVSLAATKLWRIDLFEDPALREYWRESKERLSLDGEFSWSIKG